MKRRRFLIASGSTVLAGKTVSNLVRPAFGLEFELTTIPNKEPSNIESVLIDFSKFKLTPQYLNDSKNAVIKIDVTIGQHSEPVSKEVPVTNGETVNSEDLESEIPIVMDKLEFSESSVNGRIEITVEHSSIGSETYSQSFSINKGTTLIEGFEDGNLSAYSSGYIFADTQSGSGENGVSSTTVQNGSYSGYVNSQGNRFHGIFSKSGLNAYPSAGDTFEGYVYSDTENDWWPVVLFGFQDQDNHYATKSQSNGSGIGFEVIENGSRTQLETVSLGRVLPVSSWFKTRIEWSESGDITYRVYDTSGSEIDSLSVQDTTYSSGGFGFGVYDNNGNHFNYYDNWRIV